MLSVRSKPGVVSHLEHVIVAGGARPTAENDDTAVVQDDIEIFNWIKKSSHWRKVSIKLPIPMYGFKPTISDDHLLIVGYSEIDMKINKGAYTRYQLLISQHQLTNNTTVTHPPNGLH